MLGPEAPRVAAVKKLNLVHRGKCRGFFVKFPFSLEIEGRKSAKHFANISPHFSPISSKNFARTSLWGVAGTRFCILHGAQELLFGYFGPSGSHSTSFSIALSLGKSYAYTPPLLPLH